MGIGGGFKFYPDLVLGNRKWGQALTFRPRRGKKQRQTPPYGEQSEPES